MLQSSLLLVDASNKEARVVTGGTKARTKVSSFPSPLAFPCHSGGLRTEKTGDESSPVKLS